MDNLYNLEAEKAVLGAVTIDRNVLDKINWLEPDHFFHEVHGMLFSYMKTLHEEDKPIDEASILEEIIRVDNTEILSYVSELFIEIASKAITAANVDYYANAVYRHFIRRKGVILGEDIKNLSTGQYGGETALYDEMIAKVDELRPRNKARGLKHISKTKKEFMEHMKAPDDFIKTGSKAFDEWGGGYARKTLVIKAGRPSVGKTAQTIQDIMGIAAQGEGVIPFFTQEMPETQVKQRMIACRSGINYTRLRRKWIMQHDSEVERLNKAYDELEKLPIFIDDTSGITTQHIRSECRRIVREEGKIAAIVVDYLSLMKIPIPKGVSYPKAIGMVVWECKQMAVEFNCVFILICMMGRSGDGTTEPKMSDLKESGDIEQHADVVEFLWVDPTDEASNDGKIVTRTIAKGRDTGAGVLKYLFRGYIQRFDDIQIKKKEKEPRKK